MEIEELSNYHQRVWGALQELEIGERITGADLQVRTGIQDKRTLYRIINELRKNGFLVGASKGSKKSGYFLIEDEDDLNRTLKSLRNAAFNQLTTAKKIELAFYKKQYGELPLDFNSGKEEIS